MILWRLVAASVTLGPLAKRLSKIEQLLKSLRYPLKKSAQNFDFGDQYSKPNTGGFEAKKVKIIWFEKTFVLMNSWYAQQSVRNEKTELI